MHNAGSSDPPMDVEVFKTNLTDFTVAQSLLTQLSSLYPHLKCNFALDDSDRILRIKGEPLNRESIIELVEARGYECGILI